MAPQNNAAPAGILAAMSCLLLILAWPQVTVAWLTAPRGLDHTQTSTLDAAARANYAAALNILPQSQNFYVVADDALREPNLTTAQRDQVINMLSQAAALTPGNTQVWYLLAAALEPEIADPDRRALWDHALSMSLLTGPFARDLTLPRTFQITQHWDTASPELKNLWQEQIITYWGADPNNMHAVYVALPADSQKIVLATLGEVPEAETDE